MSNVFPSRLRKLCEGKTVAECARSWGISQAALDRYTKGQRTPNGEAIITICQATGVSADWLLGLSTAAPPVIQPRETISRGDAETRSDSYWRDLVASQQQTIALLVRRLEAPNEHATPAATGGRTVVKSA